MTESPREFTDRAALEAKKKAEAEKTSKGAKKKATADVPEGIEPPGPGQTLHSPSLHRVQPPFEGVLIKPEDAAQGKSATLGGEGQTKEEWDAEHLELTAALKKAQQDLWDHLHPVIVSPQAVADQQFAEQKKSEKESSKSSGPVHPGGSPEDVKRQSERTSKK